MTETVLKEKSDLTPIILFILNLIILVIMFQKGIQGAGFYLTLGSFFTLIFYIAGQWFGSQNIIFQKSPFSKTTAQGSTRFVLGITVAIIILSFKTILNQLTNHFFIYSTTTVDTFLAGAFRLTQWTISALSAAIIEEIIFGITFTAIGMILGDYILGALNVKLDNKQYWWATFIIGNIFSIGMFALFHIFNPVYTTLQIFIAAAIFRLIMNIISWIIFDINFTIAFHLVNNTIYLGLSTFIGAIFTPIGILTILLLGTMILYTIQLIKKDGITAPFKTAIGQR